MTNQEETSANNNNRSPQIYAEQPVLNLTTTNNSNIEHQQVSSSISSSIANKYIDPDTVAPPGCVPIDPKTNPLALLAQTCSNIGKDLQPNNNSKPIIGAVIETSSNSSSISNSSISKIQAPAPKISPPPQQQFQQQQRGMAPTLKRPRALSPPQIANNSNNAHSSSSSSVSPPSSTISSGISPRQSSTAADAVTNALNALEQAVRGNPMAAQHFELANQLADLSKMSRLSGVMEQSQGSSFQGPPAKISKQNGCEQAPQFAAQLFNQKSLQQTTPLNNSNNNRQASVDQQQLYAAYLAQLMRTCGQQAAHQPQSPLPPTPPPPVQQQGPPGGQNNNNGTNDIWSMVLHSYNAKQQQQQQQAQQQMMEQAPQNQKILPIRPQPRASTPGTFVCNWLVIGTQFCGKKFATKEALVEHVSLAHCSGSNNSPVPQPPVPPIQQTMIVEQPQSDNNNSSPASLYQTMLYGYLSSLMGAAVKSAPTATVSPSNTMSSTRSENSPIFPPQAGQGGQGVMEQPTQLNRLIHQTNGHSHPSPPSPPHEQLMHPNGAQIGFDQQQALVASFLQQLSQNQPQNNASSTNQILAPQVAAQMAQMMSAGGHHPVHHPSVEQAPPLGPVDNNFFARQALQQQRLQAAVLAAAAAKNSAQHF